MTVTAGSNGAGPLLVAESVTKSFSGFLALKTATLVVPRGSISALIGPNGAGKSTLFGIIAGSVRPTAGKVLFDGQDVTGLPAWRRARMGMSRAFQVARFFPSFTVEENIRGAILAQHGVSWQFYRGENPPEVAGEVRASLDVARLTHLAGTKAEHLSQGDRKRLELTMATSMRPKLLLLDEPTAGMSPPETASTIDLIRWLWKEQGCTVLLTEHDMAVVFNLAEQITVLNLGEIIAEGAPDEISRDQHVIDAYLGEPAV
jgi:branched-chain amino acid transport system ATP-binding protein